MSAHDTSAFVSAVRRRWRMTVALKRASVAFGGAAVLLFSYAISIRLLHASGDSLAAIAGGSVVVIIAWMLWAMSPVRERADDLRVARFIEERQPALEDGLVTAVQMRDDDRVFARAVRRRADSAVSALSPRDIIPSADLQRHTTKASAAAAVLLVAVFASSAPLSRAWDAMRVRLFPYSITLEVHPGDARVVTGAPLQVRARVSGLPGSYGRPPVLTILRNGRLDRRDMTAHDGVFLVPFRSVTSNFRYRVDVGGVHSREYAVTVLPRPHITGLDVTYAYPPYTGLAPRTERDAGDVYAPAGTRVTIQVRTDKRVQHGELRLDQQSVRLSATLPPEATFVVARDVSYRVFITDQDGLGNESPTEYFVRVTDDRPPEVRILRPEGDRQVTPLEEVRIDARADDDYRLDKLELVYAVGAGSEHTVAIGPRDESSIAGSYVLPLEDLHVRPGDIVRYYARTREQAHRSGGREARSDMFFLEVTPFDGRFALAQSQAGGAASAEGDLQALIAAQKNVINATWNLLRRMQRLRGSIAGADVRALAEAQKELRARTVALSGALTSASLMMQSRAGDQGDALGNAARAMARAVDELERTRLNGALPHEMEALTALMRAQSEDAKRDVQQRAATTSFGNGRSGQDVSGLFDRELLRQQQTSYENQSSADPHRTISDSDADRRIRELAQRQDELAQAQRQLAAGALNGDERRRELERLTREQEQLRQDAERVARDLSRERADGTEARSRALREAAQEMQRAGGDLRRNDVASATRRGGRAAERLRGAQQGASGGGASTTAAELQGEAQQLASEQRDLERRRDDGRNAGGGPGAHDRDVSRRQLAVQQRQLADRAEALERNVRALSRGGSGKDQAASAAAAREMQRSRIAERMRSEGDRLERGGAAGQNIADGRDSHGSRPLATSGDSSGSTSTSLASALDRVADRLGSTADARSRKLNDELAKGRAARERLNELGRQIERAAREGNEPARDALSRAMEDTRRLVRELRGSSRDNSIGGYAPEEQQWSDSAPGLESFKQDYSRWEDLKRTAELAIERRETTIGRELAGIKSREALAAGSINAVPEEYRARVARYFEALARAGRRP